MGNSQGKPIDADGEGMPPPKASSTHHSTSAKHECSAIVNLNHFRLLRVVGRGAFGKVRIVERKDTNLSFALKYIRKDDGTPSKPSPKLLSYPPLAT